MSELINKVWIYGHHIKPQWQELTSLKELAARNVGRIPELIAGKNLSSKSSKQWKSSDEIPADDDLPDEEDDSEWEDEDESDEEDDQ